MCIKKNLKDLRIRFFVYFLIVLIIKHNKLVINKFMYNLIKSTNKILALKET